MRHRNTIFYLHAATMALIILITANNTIIIHTAITIPYAYLSAVWAGSEDPVWPHLVLVPLSALAGIAVGVGIVLERPVFSPAIHRIAFWSVALGVAIEAVCTLSLFVVDERISSAQQTKILTLEAQEMDRSLDRGEQTRLTDAMSTYGGNIQVGFLVYKNDVEAYFFASQLRDSLGAARWIESSHPIIETNISDFRELTEGISIVPSSDLLAGWAGYRLVLWLASNGFCAHIPNRDQSIMSIVRPPPQSVVVFVGEKYRHTSVGCR